MKMALIPDLRRIHLDMGCYVHRLVLFVGGFLIQFLGYGDRSSEHEEMKKLEKTKKKKMAKKKKMEKKKDLMMNKDQQHFESSSSHSSQEQQHVESFT